MQRVENPVFILGLHRSGTTLLYEMLSEAGIWNHVSAWHVIEFDQIDGAEIDVAASQAELAQRFNDLGLVTRGVDVVGISPHTKEEYGFILDNHGYGFQITRKSLDFFHHACCVINSTFDQPRPLLLKNPWDFGNAYQIKQMIPDARFVFIHRDPLHSITSLLRFTERGMDEPMPYVQMLSRRYERVISSRPKLALSRFGLKHLKDAYVGLLIRNAAKRCNRYRRFASQIDSADRVDLRYEDLCNQPNETMKRIFDHFGLTPQRTDYRDMIGKRKSSAADVVVKQKRLIQKLMNDYLDQVGVRLEE